MSQSVVQQPRSTPSWAIRSAVALILASAAARGAQLPVPCAAGTCGRTPSAPVGWSTNSTGQQLNPGAASFVQFGNRLNVTQSQNCVVLNWRSFNISADGTVTFIQPSSTAVALNRVFDANPSQINGALNSNGQVYLLNQNGFLFGANAVVNVGGLLASSLNITPEAIQKGIAAASSANNNAGAPSFTAYDNGLPSGTILVSAGATITSNQGQVYLFAPSVENEGLIQTPSGQTILAAGQRVFLRVSGDPDVRGLVIQVGDSVTSTGTVTNGPTGQIVSTAGNVTLAALAVNQNGRVSATTTVRSNGSIRLQAQDTTDLTLPSSGSGSGDGLGVANRSGTLILGPSSQTSVSLQGGPDDTTVDINPQPKSSVVLDGGSIQLRDHASIVAPGGNVTLNALSDAVVTSQQNAPLGSTSVNPDQARIYLAPTSTIDVSGADVSLPMSANSLTVQLRGSEFADFPQQRTGPLRGKTVSVDLRQYGTRSDGSPWVGTPIADLSGDISTIQRDVFARNLKGGTINLNASGSVIVSQGATLNVSGGRIDYQSGYVNSSTLLGADGKAQPIATANPDATYTGTVDSITQSDPHWGTSVTVTLPIKSPQGQYQAGYTEGKDAGFVNIIAPAAILDGTFNGGVTIGPNQRLAPTARNLWPLQGQLYRPYNQVPVGGTLSIGNPNAFQNALTERQVLQNVIFAPGTLLNTLSGVKGRPFDPTWDPLPAGFMTSIRPDLLSPGSMSNLQVYAEGNITVPAGVRLAPGAGGSVSLNAGQVDLAGSIDIPGGSATLSAAPTIAHPAQSPIPGGDPHGALPGLVIEPSATIDVSGEWVNDSPVVAGGGTPPLFISGGQVSLVSTQGSLLVPTGAVVNVSGGAQRTASGNLVAGKAGSITIAAHPGEITSSEQFVVGGLLQGYALSAGGTLTLGLPALCISALPCSEKGLIRTDPSLFTDFGFANLTLQGFQGSLTVASDVDLSAKQENLLLLPMAFSQPSARSLAGLTRVALLPDYLRQPESITFKSSTGGQVAQGEQPLPYALTVADGARVALDPGGSLSLIADSKIIQNGALIVPAGQVKVRLVPLVNNSDGSPSYFADQAIWLGPSSVIDVSGVVQRTPNTLNLELGSVLPGGSITVEAQGGYLFAAPGSALTAAGTTGTLDLRSPGTSTYTRSEVGSAGGSMTLYAAEGMHLDGSLAAPAGTGSNAAGGSLSITLSGNHNSLDYPLSAPSNLAVSATSAPFIVAEGSAVPVFLNGKGGISAATVNAGGFDNVSLIVRNLATSGAPGSVTFDSGVSLAPAASLVIDAPQIRGGGAGGVVTLHSDYVALGSTDTTNQYVNATPTVAPSSLHISGNLVDLVGAFDISGFGTTTIASTGDLRAVGVQSSASANYVGALTLPGTLTLAAQQIYPTTLTTYSINVVEGGGQPSLLTVSGPPGGASAQARAVLSAAGNLALQADQIADSGVLRAPMGSINLTATGITLQPSAVISVSTEGLTIPFGQTQGGFDWVYALQASGFNQLTQVYGVGAGDVLPPQKQVTLTANTVTLQADPGNPKKGATIDLSGGGDLLAYEYVPGLGGNADALAPKSVRNSPAGNSTGRGTYAPDVFAIVPTLDLPYAPIDPHEDIGFNTSLQGIGFNQSVFNQRTPAGASVHLSSGDGLAAGTYALLPARYALLPGAYLVRPVSGYTNLAAGQTVAQLDGSVIVSGYRTYGGTGLADTQTSGWDITRGTYALQEAQYNLTTANSFFAAQATAAKVSTPRLPADAGALAITAKTAAILDGQLLTSAPTGARGATVDLSSQNLIITNNPQSAPAGYVALDPNQLDALGAESLLIGGTRTAAVNATDISVGASNVVVDQGVHLTGQELVFAATGSLSIDANASVLATGSPVKAEAAFQLPTATGAAMVRVSTGPQTGLQSASTSGGSMGPSPPPAFSGNITVASGAVVGAPGSVSFDAGGAVNFAGSLSAAGAAIRLGASEIALGAVPQGFKGFAIGSALFPGITNSDLELTSPAAALQIYGPVSLTLAKLNINTLGLTDETPDAAFTVSAGDLTLTSPSTQTFSSAASGTGSVQLSATRVTLAGGTFTVAGAANTVLSASQDITATGGGTLGVAGNLRLESAVTQSTAGVNYNFATAGDPNNGALATALLGTASGPTSASGPGSALSFAGQSVTLGGNIVLPAGQVTATASGSVMVASGASINVAGFADVFDGKSQSAPGGAVKFTSASGGVTVAAGATLDVSAGTGAASGGSLALIAPSGTVSLGGQLHAAGGTGQAGADLTIDAQHFNDFASLVTQAGAAGFTGRWGLRSRGGDNLVLPSGSTLRASDVSLSTDQQGSVGIFGAIDTRSTPGGQITLAGYNVEVGGTLLAGSTTRSDRGGTIQLFSSGGNLYVDSGAQLSVGGVGSTATGTVQLRAPAQNVLNVLSNTGPLVRLDGTTISGAANVYLEGFNQYTSTTVADAGMQVGGTYYTAAQQFYNSAMMGPTTVAQALLGSGSKPSFTFTVLPGVEIDSSAPNQVADLHVAPVSTSQSCAGPCWDLSAWRFGATSTSPGTPGVLTLRATGNLYVDGSISDGVVLVVDPNNPFPAVPLHGAGTLGSTGPSWSYRLVAGADLNAADPLSVVGLPELSALGTDTGNVIVAKATSADPNLGGAQSPTVVRTGTGFIAVAAAGDVRLESQASVIYTVGVANPTGLTVVDPNSYFDYLPYPTGGGNVTVSAGRDIIGATSNQLFTDWLWRTGAPGSPSQGYVPTSWTPSIDFFEQGIGALGGGDVTVSAGRNVVDLGANVPSVGRPVGDGKSAAATTTQEVNAGILRVSAGGDIDGGKFLDMAGQAYLRAGGGLTAGTQQNGPSSRGLYPVIAVGSGQFDLTARGSVSIETVLDPTLLPESTMEAAQGIIGNDQQFFATYADSSSVALRSVGSDVTLVNQASFGGSLLQQSATNMNLGAQGADYTGLRVFAPNLAAVSFGGNVNVTGSMDLWPSAHGNLDLLAADSVLFQQSKGNAFQVLMWDTDPSLLPSVGNLLLAGQNSTLNTAFSNAENPAAAILPGAVQAHASSPVHGGAFSLDKQPDTVPARIVALSGNVSVTTAPGSGSLISIPKQADVVAGKDISELSLTVQQFAANNISNIVAGRDIAYPTSRVANGTLAPNLDAIVFDGPGRATISAGRNINLGTSGGIVSEGNLHNTALAVGGANLSVSAGVPGNPDYQSFIDTYLSKSDLYDTLLIQYIEGIDGTFNLTKSQALTEFTALPVSQQSPLIKAVFFDELRAGGRSAAAAGPTHNNFTRAFGALTTLFPGSNPDLSTGATNPYLGDILLYFSQIYTLQGGDINLLAPGGQINVGLATAPTAFGVTKLPSQLGVVAQSVGSVNMLAYNDIQVNQSRVFAADGGNILMWSTEGNIDAGRGAKTAVSAPPPTITVDPATGAVTVTFPTALAGSGIQALATSTGTSPGDVDLFAPHGVVNANDAGIVAGNLTIAATAVLNASNITVSGTAVGLPPAIPALGAISSAASATGSAATSIGESNAGESNSQASKAPLASTALSWLDVFVLGLGEEQCRTNDLECLKRQKH